LPISGFARAWFNEQADHRAAILSNRMSLQKDNHLALQPSANKANPADTKGAGICREIGSVVVKRLFLD
jgi:hypothetical protein